MKRREDKDPRIAIVYPHLPHYRYGVFHELDNQVQDLAFISGLTSRDSSIAVIPPKTFRREYHVQNRWIGPVLWQSGLGKALREYDPDEVIFLGDAAHASTWFYSILGRLSGKRVHFWTIGWHRRESGWRRNVRLAFYRLANDLLLYGNYGRIFGEEAGYPPERMFVIYNSYESRTDESAQRVRLGEMLDDPKPTIGAVARLSINKELEEIVWTADTLRNTFGIDARVLIAGEGPLRAALEDLAEALGISLCLPGAVYHPDDLALIYEQLDITVIPRAAGLTVLQSLGSGTPVVTASDPEEQMPEFEAIIDGVNGSLVDTPDRIHIAHACAHWITLLETQREEVQNACRETASAQWSPSAQAGAILRALRESHTPHKTKWTTLW